MASTFGLFGVTPLLRLCAYARAPNRVMVATTPSSNPQSAWVDSNPTVLDGDFAEYEGVTTPNGFTVVLGADGIAVIQAGGNTTRQSFLVNHFSRYTLDFTGDARQTDGNSIPSAATQNLVMTVGVLFSLDFRSVTLNVESDPLTYEKVSGNPPDEFNLVNGVLTGTPILTSSGTFSLFVSDGLDSSAFTVNWTVNPSSTGTTAGPLVDGNFVKTHVGGALVQ